MAKNFSEDFYHFNSEYQRINRHVSKECKNIEKTSKAMANHYFKLSVELDNLQKLVLTKTEIP